MFGKQTFAPLRTGLRRKKKCVLYCTCLKVLSVTVRRKKKMRLRASR